MNNKKNIVLIGMMGAGKSTVGQLLNEKLADFSYVDLDALIEANEKKSIPEIFAKYGEKHFRQIECELVKSLSDNNNQVISTGGGVVESPENIELLKENGVIFYLSATADEIFSRIKNETHRPLLQTPNPLETIKEIMQRREKLYKTADFEISTKNKSPNEIAEEIIEKYLI